jgi:hypothetical protein
MSDNERSSAPQLDRHRLVVEKVARRFFARQIAVFSAHIGCVPPYEMVSMRSASTPLDTRYAFAHVARCPPIAMLVASGPGPSV